MADRNSKIPELKKFYKNIMQGGPLLYNHQFTISFSGDIPSFVQNGIDPDSITYYGKSATIPKVDIQEQEISFLSQKFIVPKQVTYGENWNVKIMLDQNMRHYLSLYAWQNQFASLQLDGGGLKVIPDTYAHVTILDASLQYEISRFTLVGVFPSKIPDLQMQYENASNILDFDCQFTYQYLYDNDDGDPLAAGNHV